MKAGDQNDTERNIKNNILSIKNSQYYFHTYIYSISLIQLNKIMPFFKSDIKKLNAAEKSLNSA